MNNVDSADCLRAGDLLADDWQHELDVPARADDRHWLGRHLEACADCRGLSETWEQLGALPPPATDPAREAAQRARFEAMLKAGGRCPIATAKPTGVDRRAWPDWGWSAALAAAILLAVGWAGGWWVRGVARPPAAVTLTASNGAASLQKQVADLRGEVEQTRQLAVLSLLQGQSANDRLQGVSYSARLPRLDAPIEQALLRTLNYDSSPDVRLAALEVLGRQGGQPGLKTRLLEAFAHQSSPLVQVALMDSFVAMHNDQARPLLEKAAGDKALLPAVREHAAWGLTALAHLAWN